uniref:Ig-like domain-containing protein n=1 Tax=Anolis carolinensis TaxID=28377 RepID=H9GQF6_ANOCA
VTVVGYSLVGYSLVKEFCRRFLYVALKDLSQCDYFDYWGDGTFLLVSEATPTAPAVFPLTPCCQDLSAASEVRLGCLVTGYFPDPVTVQWNSGAISTGIRTFPAVLQSSSGHYTLSSQLTVPVSSWNTENFQCKVIHAPTSSTIEQRIERCVTHSPVAPDVRLLHSSCSPRSTDASIELVCILSNFYPKEVSVEWLIGGKSGLLPSYTEPPRQDAVGYTFSTTSSANISQADWLEGTIYTCKVTHAGSQTTMRARAKKCEDDSTSQCDGIYVYLKSPTPNDLYLNRDPKVSCVVGNLESEEGLKVSWSRDKKASLDPEPMSVSEELNGTYTVVSALPILTREWDSEETFTCTVEYPGVPTPIVKKITKLKGKVTTPSVYLFRPHREELIFQSHSQLTLTCLVKNLNPKDVSVQWLKDNNALTEDNHITTPVLKDSIEDSYFVYSKLSISRADWDRGSSYTCMVIHEGLAMKFTQRTVEKSQGKK